jgi:hypothetical protein
MGVSPLNALFRYTSAWLGAEMTEIPPVVGFWTEFSVTAIL